MTTPLDPEALAASDPRTSPVELTRIANARPDLHSAIYANPSTHLELKQWIETYYPDAVRNAAAFAAGSVATTQQYPAIPQHYPATNFGSQAGVLDSNLKAAVVLQHGSRWELLPPSSLQEASMGSSFYARMIRHNLHPQPRIQPRQRVKIPLTPRTTMAHRRSTRTT